MVEDVCPNKMQIAAYAELGELTEPEFEEHVPATRCVDAAPMVRWRSQPPSWGAYVVIAPPVRRKEILETPAAQAAQQKEWKRLR